MGRLFDKSDWDRWVADQEVIRIILGSDRPRNWWIEIASPSFHTEFVAVVNHLVIDQPQHDYVKRILLIG